MRSEGFDVAVLGAGIGGLAVAALLARAGRAVIVLERAREAGGVCQPIRREACCFEVGGALLSGFGPGRPLQRLCERLGLHLPVSPCDPQLQVVLPRHRVSLYADPERVRSEIRREFPVVEEGWQALWSELDLLAAEYDRALPEFLPLPPEGWQGRVRFWRASVRRAVSGLVARANGQLARAQATPFRATLRRHGLDGASRQVVEATLYYLLLRDSDECSTLDAALALQEVRRGVVSLPGGSAALVEALVQQFQRDGGTLRLEAEVARCLVERGRVVGAVLTGGEPIRAGLVVADVPPGILGGTLLPPRRRWFVRRGRLDRPWAPRVLVEAMLLRVPARLLPSELGGLCLIAPEPDRPPRDENLVFLRSISAGDGDQAVQERRPLAIGRFLPPRENQDEEPGAILLEALELVAPGVASAADYRELLAPADLAAIWGRPSAAVAYAATARSWLGQGGASHRTEWPGLLVAGEWTYPGRLLSNVAEGALRVADLVTERA
jgi:phytoene dehydrogenase-like protein